ncbi:MAG: hypothetical protein ACKVS8_10535 [Phycisphaerales bacterium]
MSTNRVCVSVSALMVVLATGSTASGAIVAERFAGLRVPMPGEGYIGYRSNPATAQFGHEWTGWVDVRHPAMNGVTQTFDPFDRSTRQVDVRTTTVADNAGVAATPNVDRDFDNTNKAYAQMGISVIRSETGTLALNGAGGAPNTAWPLDQDAGDDGMKERSRSAQAKTVNSYYVQQYGGDAPNGLASQSHNFGGAVPRKDGFGVANAAVSSTFAHELGHMLLNGPALSGNDTGNGLESENNDNLMFKTGQTFAFSAIGKTRAKVTDAQIDRIFSNGGANNPGFVQNNGERPAWGDRVDWDFVTDHARLETRANGADDHAGVDSLYWETNTPTVASSHAGPAHDHTGLGEFMPTPDFAGTFRFADVFSLTLRYADFDPIGDPASQLLSAGALDYRMFFRDAMGNTAEGTPILIFDLGWTANTNADNFLVRWQSPFDAVGVFAFADAATDGIAQFDAVIVSNIPSPGAAAMVAAGVLLGSARRRR